MRTIAILLFIIINLPIYAQRSCATHEYTEAQMNGNAAAANRMRHIESFIQEQARLMPLGSPSKVLNSNTHNIIYIPVVVHVLYNNNTQNISDEQVKSQIDALNRDFRKNNSDTASIPAQFKAIAADVQIEFVLATADPKGRPTTGIVRKNTSVKEWRMDDKIKSSAQGGSDAWDTKSYLNFWVGNLRKVLGYATLPGSDAAMDGIVMNASVFGTINTRAPYNLGRTAVHEVGHWLGLRHIWGDAACGDDLVYDTPQQGSFTSGAPSGFRTSCSNAPLGDMYMNYMDFTDDVRLVLFTKGQKDRMRAMLSNGGPRNTILASKGLSKPWSEAKVEIEEILPTPMQVYPNPASAWITVNCNNKEWIGKELSVVNINGVTVKKVIITSTIQRINVTALPRGAYFIQGNCNGNTLHQKLLKL